MPRNAYAVSIPATSANLGPGFDAVGIALSMQLRARVAPARRFSIDFSGNSIPSHDGYEKAIVTAMRRISPSLPPVAMHVDNDIPLGKGLGSSAAASILGLLIASRANGGATGRREIAERACELEGHPDNALAAVYGGAVIAASGSRVNIPAPKGIAAVIVVPQIELATKEARALLPQRYSKHDVAFTAARASLLGAALASGAWGALREAMRDRMHQPYRAKKIPGLPEALALEAQGLLGVALSGAGPSVIAFVRERSATSIASRLRACFERAGIQAHSYQLRFSARGAVVRG